MKTFASFVLGFRDSDDDDINYLANYLSLLEGFNKKFNYCQLRLFLNGKVVDTYLLVLDRLYGLYSEYRRKQTALGLC
jgi:hypothetical protein